MNESKSNAADTDGRKVGPGGYAHGWRLVFSYMGSESATEAIVSSLVQCPGTLTKTFTRDTPST
jgi:hypothetical protein